MSNDDKIKTDFLSSLFKCFSLKHCDYAFILDQSYAGTACLWMIVRVFMCNGTDGVCGGGE